ncbi:MAG: restriction endonuclease subunit S [Arcanobacterium sp.]
MSKIEKLIQELCPDGVEYVTLGSIGTQFSGLRGKSKKDFQEGNAKFATYTDIFNYFKFAKATGLVQINSGENQTELQKGDILFTASSENADEVAMTSVVTADLSEPTYMNSFCFGIRPNDSEQFSPDFLAHFLRSSRMRQELSRCANGVTRYNVSKPRLMKIKIPVPPLEVQQEIVRVLDLFTSLEAELEARRLQYEHYRNQIIEELKADSEMVPFSKLGRWMGGKTPSKKEPKYWIDGEIPWVSPKDMGSQEITSSLDLLNQVVLEENVLKKVPENSLLFVVRSSILAKRLPVAITRTITTINQDLRALVPSQELNAEYLFHATNAVSSDILRRAMKSGGSVNSIEVPKLMKIQIPIPSREKQDEIALRLNSFTRYISDISSGLPAEIEARRQQYEYYRDKLVTFKEKTA